jgi:hypothetical protein
MFVEEKEILIVFSFILATCLFPCEVTVPCRNMNRELFYFHAKDRAVPAWQTLIYKFKPLRLSTATMKLVASLGQARNKKN